jgi:acetyl esterase/lipase
VPGVRKAAMLPFLLSFSLFVSCSPARETETSGRAAVQSPSRANSVQPRKDVLTVIYTHRPLNNLSLDIIKPAPETSLHRGILLIHGGGWVGGRRADMDEIAHFLADKGFVTVTVDYRLAPKDVWPAQLDDVQTAVRYMRSNATELGIQPDKIGAAGVSAGGHLSLFLGSIDTRAEGEYPGVSSRVQAVGSISGIHDLNEPMTPLGEGYHIVQTLLGEKPGAIDKKARAAASPITFADKKTAPTMFIQGLNDPLVPQDQTTKAEEHLKKLGVNTTSQFVEGMGHGISPGAPQQAKALNQLVFWMFKYLK